MCLPSPLHHPVLSLRSLLRFLHPLTNPHRLKDFVVPENSIALTLITSCSAEVTHAVPETEEKN